MSKKVLVPLAESFEEIEFVSIVDVLRRARLEVCVAALDDNLIVKGAHAICIKADCSLKILDYKDFDAIALAGGYYGMMNLKQNKEILRILKGLNEDEKLVSAICASPIVLNEAGVLRGDFACYPGCEEGLKGERVAKAVVKNENLITSAGPGTAIDFALEIVRSLCGENEYKRLFDELLINLRA